MSRLERTPATRLDRRARPGPPAGSTASSESSESSDSTRSGEPGCPPSPGRGHGPFGLRRGWSEPVLNEAARRDFTRTWRRLAGVFLLFLLEPLANLWGHHPWYVKVVGVVLLVAFGYLYLNEAPKAVFGGARRDALLTLGGMSAICAVYLVVVGSEGLTMLPFVAVVAAVILPRPAGPPMVLVLAAAGTWLPQHVAAWDVDQPLWGLGAGVLIAGAVAVMMRFTAGQTDELDLAREELAELGAEQERLRIARDLHDVLGHALTTMTLKAELASRLVDVDPDRAAAEMAEVAALSRDSLADVRATLAGYREMSLAGELATSRQVLAAAGIDADLPASTEVVDGQLRELFGWALREGVTNAVRHSHARHVEVHFERRAITVVNDGVRGDDRSPTVAGGATQGHGLDGLRERAAVAGAVVEAGPEAPDRFRLRVEAPA